MGTADTENGVVIGTGLDRHHPDDDLNVNGTEENADIPQHIRGSKRLENM